MDNMVSRKKAVGIGVLAAVTCSLVTGLTVAYVSSGAAQASEELKPIVSQLNEVQQLVDEKFVGEYDLGDVEDYVLSGYVSGLGDRWSYYMTEEAYEEYKTDNKDTRVGIGITVSLLTQDDGSEALEVQTVAVGSPAEEAGFGSYDRVIGVDGSSIAELGGYEEAVDAVRGDPGTEVVLTVVDYDTGKTRDITVTRGEFEQIYVTSRVIDGDIGYVKIDRFASETDEQFIAAVDDLQEQGVSKLVFDLRNNPGGSLASLVNSLDYLLPEGKIITLNAKDGTEEVYESDADEVDLPMAVLVNADSYSAAEFFAEALREYDKAQIVGETTSGKGYSQIVYPLSNGGAVGLSSSCYYTPDGTSLIGKGVEPDVECSLTDEQLEHYYTLSDDEDTQLQAALDAVNEK
ncbi:MAG: S41 family peptidase [Eubacteriales bacterium]|nr:S41 family peptidase [Eubacteriales bacterium]